jgi:hypothetical protein
VRVDLTDPGVVRVRDQSQLFAYIVCGLLPPGCDRVLQRWLLHPLRRPRTIRYFAAFIQAVGYRERQLERERERLSRSSAKNDRLTCCYEHAHLCGAPQKSAELGARAP